MRARTRPADVARQAREAERHAPMIVQAALIGIGLDLGRKREAERFLAAGLPTLPVTPRSAPGCARARRAQACEAGQRISTTSSGASAASAAAGDGRGGDRPSLQRRGDVVMAVEARALERHEELAGLDAAAVDGDACGPPVAGPVRRPPVAATASAAVQAMLIAPPHRGAGFGAVVEGMGPAPMVWPVSWPLPAMTSRSRGRARRRPGGSRPAVADLERIRAPARTSRRIAAGFSLRDCRRDDDAIGQPRGDLAISGVCPVAIAAAAEDDDQPAAGMGRSAMSRPPARRACGNSRHRSARHWDAGPRARCGRARRPARHHGEHPLHRLAASDGEAEGGQEIVCLEAAATERRGCRAGEGLDEQALALGLRLLLHKPQIAALATESDQAMACPVLAAASWANSGASR